MEDHQKFDSSYSRVSKDVKESEPCKNGHYMQFVVVDKLGIIWQYCTRCDRRLLVR